MTSDVIAWATLVAVLATGVATVILAWKTSNMAASTEKTASASADGIELQRQELDEVKEQLRLARDQFELTSRVAAQQLKQAGATAEMAMAMRQERELAVRPYLTVTGSPLLHSGAEYDVHNVGRGPALNCMWTYVDMAEGSWYRCSVFSVAPGAVHHFGATDIHEMRASEGHSIRTPIWDYGQLNESGEHEVTRVHALFCQDETGSKLYRFVRGRVGYDVWEAGEPEPAWVRNFLQAFRDFGGLAGR